MILRAAYANGQKTYFFSTTANLRQLGGSIEEAAGADERRNELFANLCDRILNESATILKRAFERLLVAPILDEPIYAIVNGARSRL